MKTDQTTATGTNEDYWINKAKTGVWRTARQKNVCCTKPHHAIEPGQRYLDSGERDHGAQWATFKYCEAHANERDGS